MIAPFIDLHTHSLKSDGRLSPQELIRMAYHAGIRVMSITDHNSTEDLTALRAFAATEFDEEMILIQGAEVSAHYFDGSGTRHELHIVALGFDPENPGMKEMLTHNQPDRRPYINAILMRLKEECGIELGTFEEIEAHFPDSKYVGRMCLARLMTERGITSSVDEAFDIYLGGHGQRRAYVKNPLTYYSLADTVRTILQAGGTPVLAHLLYYDLDNGQRIGGEEKERLVRTFKELLDIYGGIGGMEVYYVRYKSIEERLYLLQMAQKYNLLLSAGSDYHHQEDWETLAHRTSCSVCSDLLDHLGIKVNYSVVPTMLNVLSGFSGVGKGTVCDKLRDRKIDGKPITVIRSVTNRPPRSENENYTFVSREEFTLLANSHQLLEFNDAYSTNGYGTPVQEVQAAIKAGLAPVLEIDRVGLCHLLTDGKINPNLIRSVFIAADAPDVAQRLCHRGTEEPSAIRRRLKTAVHESNFLHLYDAVVINEVVENTVEAVINAFEGNLPRTCFDTDRFRTEMETILQALPTKN